MKSEALQYLVQFLRKILLSLSFKLSYQQYQYG